MRLVLVLFQNLGVFDVLKRVQVLDALQKKKPYKNRQDERNYEPKPSAHVLVRDTTLFRPLHTEADRLLPKVELLQVVKAV